MIPQSPWAKICNPLLARAYHALRYRRLPEFPSSLILETTSRCNLNCRMCPRRDMQRPAQEMPFELYASLIGQMAEWDARDALDFVALHWFGEPLLHPQLGEMLTLAGQRLPHLLQRGALRNPVRGLSLSTNATLLDEAHARMLLDSPLTWLGVSVDGSDPETYEAMRVGGVFEQVVANVTHLLEINRREPRAFPTVAVQVIVTRTTAPQLGEFAARWEKLLGGAANARVELKPYTDWAGQVQAEELCAPDRRTDFLYLNCGYLWDTMAIGADGAVGLCCYDVNARHDLGDARETSLYDLWHGASLNALRARMARGQLADLPLCANCAMGRKYIGDYVGRRPSH
jgi:wyosine [tRNA(Phe)-imidazoG37] synthetase (radical SAM superfamily)